MKGKTMNKQMFGQIGLTILVAAGLLMVAPIQAHDAAAHDDGGGNGDAASQGSGSVDDPFTLRKGKAVFWDGPTFVGGDLMVGFGSVEPSFENMLAGPVRDDPPPFPCDLDPDVCFDYHLTLLDDGPRLRIAADSPTRSVLGIEVYGPAGSLLASRSHYFSVEVFVEVPVAGEYLVRLVAYDIVGNPPELGGTDEIDVRMRAQLAAEDRGSPHVEALEPNLRVKLRDVQLGACDEETTGFGGLAFGTTCLRFTTATENVGEGPFEVRYTTADETDFTDGTQPAYQRIHHSDGSVVERRAGSHDTLIHPTHLHYHMTGMILHELDRVTDDVRGGLDPVASDRKIGWCGGDWRMSGWDRFFQDEADATFVVDRQGSNCGLDPSQPLAVMTLGWSDQYLAFLAGQQIHFDPADGEYVVRSRFDPDNVMLETDETDNEGYVWFKLEGTTRANHTVEVLEWGYGHSPWDPHKTVLDPYWW